MFTEDKTIIKSKLAAFISDHLFLGCIFSSFCSPQVKQLFSFIIPVTRLSFFPSWLLTHTASAPDLSFTKLFSSTSKSINKWPQTLKYPLLCITPKLLAVKHLDWNQQRNPASSSTHQFSKDKTAISQIMGNWNPLCVTEFNSAPLTRQHSRQEGKSE